MGELREKSLRIAEHFFAEVDLSKTRLLHVFISIKRFYEVDTSLIVRELWSRFPGITVVAPRIDKTKAEIDSVNFRTYSELIENAWGICEPSGLELADPSEMDLVIVPLLCFDELGNRVGYGKGYYDRFLARCRPDCLKVGLSLFPPAPLIDGITNSDVPLDICITPERSYRFGPALEHLN